MRLRYNSLLVYSFLYGALRRTLMLDGEEEEETGLQGRLGPFSHNCSIVTTAFALLAHRKPHIVILDEPTNHLDMDTIQALIEAVSSSVSRGMYALAF